jgi:hypothetical protein
MDAVAVHDAFVPTGAANAAAVPVSLGGLHDCMSIER